MAAHRYWMMLFTKTGASTTLAVGELFLATTPAGAQAATGGTASASSTNGANAASRAFDTTTTAGNYWQSGTTAFTNTTWLGSEWLKYDMGSGNDIDVVEVRIYFTNGAGGSAYPVNYALFYSDDNVSWTLQRAWGDQVYTNGETKTHDATALASIDIVNREVLNRSYRYNAAALVGEPTYRTLLPRISMGTHSVFPARRTPYTGTYYLAGSTTTLGDPIARRVDLVEQKSGLLVATLHTDSTGVFSFEEIAYGPWTVVGVDNSLEQNSVIYAHVVPDPMP